MATTMEQATPEGASAELAAASTAPGGSAYIDGHRGHHPEG